MKRLDEGKVSLVEFLASIRHSRRDQAHKHAADTTQFARFSPHARAAEDTAMEERLLVRSVN